MPDTIHIDTAILQEAATAGNPAAMALLAGRCVMTVQSRKSGQHITIRLNCKRKGSRWERASYDAASHVFVEVPRPDGEWPDKVGTLYPNGDKAGQFWHATNADPARVWAAVRCMEVACGLKDWQDDQCEVLRTTNCMYCGRELTDPVSIRRGIGPTCADACSIGEHQSKNRARTAEVEAVREAQVARDEADLGPNLGGSPMVDATDPERAGAEWSTNDASDATPGLVQVRAGESAAAAYAAAIEAAKQAGLDQGEAHGHAAEVLEGMEP